MTAVALPTVLFVDPAKVSGLAWSTDLCDADLHSVSYSTERRYSRGRTQHRSERAALFKRWFTRHLEALRPAFVGYDQPNAGSNRINFIALMSLAGLASVIETECAERKISFAPIVGSQVYAYALGGGTLTTAAIEVARLALIREGWSTKKAKDYARKHAICLAAKARGWVIKDDNEADALFGLHFICGLIQRGEIKV